MPIRVKHGDPPDNLANEVWDEVPLHTAVMKLATNVVENANGHMARNGLEELEDKGNSIKLLLSRCCDICEPQDAVVVA